MEEKRKRSGDGWRSGRLLFLTRIRRKKIMNENEGNNNLGKMKKDCLKKGNKKNQIPSLNEYWMNPFYVNL